MINAGSGAYITNLPDAQKAIKTPQDLKAFGGLSQTTFFAQPLSIRRIEPSDALNCRHIARRDSP
jgi:hypothetical protein